MKTDWGYALKRWRKQNGISQQQASDIMKRYHVPITISAIRAWEQGRPPGDMAAYGLQAFLREFPIIEDPPPRYPGCRPGQSEKDKAEMRALRANGMELEAIGRKFGLTESGVSRILSGKSRRNPENKSVTIFPTENPQ